MTHDLKFCYQRLRLVTNSTLVLALYIPQPGAKREGRVSSHPCAAEGCEMASLPASFKLDVKRDVIAKPHFLQLFGHVKNRK